MKSCNLEAPGGESAMAMLNILLACKSQAEAAPEIIEFLQNLGEIRGANKRRGFARGAAASLVDVLLLGVQAVKERSRK